MKTQNQTKRIPDFILYSKTEDGCKKKIGVAYNHSNGRSLNIHINNKKDVLNHEAKNLPHSYNMQS